MSQPSQPLRRDEGDTHRPDRDEPAHESSSEIEVDAGDRVDQLLREADGLVESLPESDREGLAGLAAYKWAEFPGTPTGAHPQRRDSVPDLELDLTIELGRTGLRRTEAATLDTGSVVMLDQLVEDPVDVFVDGRLVARGEILDLHDTFCVRISQLITEDSIEPDRPTT